MQWMDLIAIFLGFSFLWQLVIVLRSLERFTAIPFLRPGAPAPDGRELPLLSVILPTLDDGECLEQAVESILADDSAELEVLIVDRGSREESLALASQITEGDPRVRLLRVEGTPEGWSNLAFALHRGASEARGAHLAPMDVRARLTRGCLAAARDLLATRGVPHLALMPRFTMGSFWERAIEPHFLQAVPIEWTAINSAEQSANFLPFIGLQLFDRETWESEPLRAELRAVKHSAWELGPRTRRAGIDSFSAAAPELVAVRHHRSLGELWSGWAEWFECVARLKTDQRWRIGAQLPCVLLYYLALAVPWVVMPTLAVSLTVGGWDTLRFTCVLLALAACATSAMHRRILNLQYGVDHDAWALFLQPLSALAFSAMALQGCWRALRGARDESEAARTAPPVREEPGPPAVPADTDAEPPKESIDETPSAHGSSPYTSEA